MFAKHGFQNFVERVGLGRFLVKGLPSYSLEKYTQAERLRMAFEELGPVFIKFGQLLSTRSEILPEELAVEFKKLQDRVRPLTPEELELTLKENLGYPADDVFSYFEKEPLAAASIAQVHRATLKSGQKVVVKVQRPDIQEIIHEDSSLLKQFAYLTEKYIAELRIYNPRSIVDEFLRTLKLETNFIVEANNIKKMSENFVKNTELVMPKVFTELSNEKFLVMDELQGKSLSQIHSVDFEVDLDVIMGIGLDTYLEMVFKHGFFHGDLHAGNMFVLPGNKLGLVDFGVVGRLNSREQGAITNMLVALATEDYERLAYEYSDIAPYAENLDIYAFARELRDILAPYYGLNMKNVNSGKLLVDAAALAAKHKLLLPPELILFFKSVVSVEGVGRSVKEDFDFLNTSLFFAKKLGQAKYDPKRMGKELIYFSRDVNSLLVNLPRQLKQLLKRFSSRDFSFEIDVYQLKEVRQAVDRLSRSLFLGLTQVALLLSASLFVVYDIEPKIFSIPSLSFVGYCLSALIFIAAGIKRK